MELTDEEFSGPLSIASDDLPMSGGIYVVASNNEGEFEPLYIGVATNIRRRIHEHKKHGGIFEKTPEDVDLSLFYLEFSSDRMNEARNYERQLIDEYAPSLNIGFSRRASRKNEEKKNVEKARKFSSIVAAAASSIAIAIAASLLFGVTVQKKDIPSDVEITNKVEKLESLYVNLQLETESIKSNYHAITKLPKGSNVLAETKIINQKLTVIDKRMSALEAALTTDPAKALAVPILRMDLDNTQERFKSDLAQNNREIERIYDQNKWFIGLMITIAISVLGMSISTFFNRKDS